MSTTPTLYTDLSADFLAGLDYREYIGTLLLSLATYGAYSGVSWAELERAAWCLAEERKWRTTSLIAGALDSAIGGRQS
ncbi:MAG: hypothetical protein IIC50_23025 [Planctomycetes bacterium]|nr:hypothetical protein [Planctomycetota bacterium]